MLARIAENIFWLGRYLERVEDMARLVSVNTSLKLDLPRGIAPTWDGLVTIIGAEGAYRERYEDDFDEQRVVRFLLSDKQAGTSVLASLTYARSNARSMRDLLPREAFEHLNTLFHYASDELNVGLSKRGRFTYLSEIIEGCQTFDGILAGTMQHDQAYDFYHLGRHLERADMTTRIIDVRSQSLIPDDLDELRPFDVVQWMSILRALSAHQMYRRVIQGPVGRADALRFLFQSDAFPRSVRFSMARLDSHLEAIGGGDEARHQIARLLRMVQEVDPVNVGREALSALIDEIQVALADVQQCLASTYFNPIEESLPADN